MSVSIDRHCVRKTSLPLISEHVLVSLLINGTSHCRASSCTGQGAPSRVRTPASTRTCVCHGHAVVKEHVREANALQINSRHTNERGHELSVAKRSAKRFLQVRVPLSQQGCVHRENGKEKTTCGKTRLSVPVQWGRTRVRILWTSDRAGSRVVPCPPIEPVHILSGDCEEQRVCEREVVRQGLSPLTIVGWCGLSTVRHGRILLHSSVETYLKRMRGSLVGQGKAAQGCLYTITQHREALVLHLARSARTPLCLACWLRAQWHRDPEIPSRH